MRIAFFVNQFPNTSETFILNQITGLIDKGHTVHIYANYYNKKAKIHPVVKQYKLLDRCRFLCKIISSSELKNFEMLKTIILKSVKDPYKMLLYLKCCIKDKQFFDLKYLQAMLSFPKKVKYDVICCHFGYNGMMGILLRDTDHISGKVATFFHGNDISQYIKQKGKNTYKYLFKKGELFLPISNRWRRKLIFLGCSDNKIVVHRMGINTEFFKKSATIKKDSDKITILTVGRLVEKKGIEFGIKAVSKIIKEHPNYKIEYLIIGSGPLERNLKNLIKSENVELRIKLLGAQNQDVIKKYLEKADIFLAPSVTSKNGDQEGIPVSIMEAMAMELPVITSKHSGINELIQEGISGFMVNERNIETLADRLFFLIDNSDIRKQMGKKGREFICENYNIDSLNNRLEELFLQL